MKTISFSAIILFVSMYAAGAIAEATRIQLIADIPIADAPTITTLSATPSASTSNPNPEMGGTGGPSFATDGNMATRWESLHNVDPSWLTLDFGATYDLTEVVIHWEASQ